MNAYEILSVLESKGFPTYFVGGFVRDSIMNKKSHDIDIATKATPDEIVDIFKGSNKVQMVGEQFGVTLVNGIEVATFRSDIHNGIGDSNCTVEYADSIEEDLSRRDLTINAMAMDAYGVVHDPFNGEDDIKEQVVRFVGNPWQRICEDPNRMIRACRFVTLFEHGCMDDDSYSAIQEHSDMLFPYIAKERIRLEILKAMGSKYPSVFWGFLRLVGILDKILPDMAASYDMDGGKHHDETVWRHLMEAGDSMSPKRPLIRLAAYLHDIGKPAVFDGENFLEHEHVGKSIVEESLHSLKFSTREVSYVAAFADLHMRQFKGVKKSTVRRLLRDLEASHICYLDFIRMRMADHKANLKNQPYSFTDLKSMILAFEDAMLNTPISQVKLAINGNDVMSLGVEQGPEVGRINRLLMDLVLENPELNTKEHLTSVVLGEIRSW